MLAFSGTMTEWGAHTFVGMAAMRSFAAAHPLAVRRVLKVMELMRADYAAAKAQAAVDGARSLRGSKGTPVLVRTVSSWHWGFQMGTRA